MSSPLNYHIDSFFGEIGRLFYPTTLDCLGIQHAQGAGTGFQRKIEIIRTQKDGQELGCMVYLRIEDGKVELVVTVWTRSTPGVIFECKTDTVFPLSTPPEIIAGYMISRFPELP